jgi:O-methyltransferase
MNVHPIDTADTARVYFQEAEVSDPMQPPAKVRDLKAELRHKLMARALQSIYAPKPAQTWFPQGDKRLLYDVAAEKFGSDPITYLEFGVHRGGSFRQIASRFKHPESRLYGFDSFEGLPEAWRNMDTGHFSTGGEEPDFSDSRAAFIKGWFQNTVPAFLSSHALRNTVLVHFDADLYSSTLFLMTSLWHFVPEYYFLFDEFTPDEVVAMYDFCDAYPVDFEFIACTQDENARPLQVFGHLKRKELVLP